MKTANLIVLCLSALLINNLLAAGNAETGKAKTAACAACHGPTGDSAAPNFPRLAGQNASYLVKQLQDFKKSVRKDPTMNGIVQGLSDQDMEDIAAFYQSQKAGIGVAESQHVRLGQKIYEGGNPRTNVPACIGCHSPTGLGNGPAKFPAVAGQHAAYTEKQLKDFRLAAQTVLALQAQGKDVPESLPGRTNDVNRIMQKVVQDMTDAEIQAVSSYMQGLRANLPVSAK